MNIRINFVFWKEGPLLFDCAHRSCREHVNARRQSKLPRILACEHTST